MKHLPPKIEQLLEDISFVEDRNDRLMMLVDFADRFQEVPSHIAERPFPENHRVQRCESEAYVWTEQQGDGLKLHFAVENPQGISAKAMAVILDESLSGESPETILKTPTDVVFEIFGKELSMGKGQGLMGMIELTRLLAKKSLVESSGQDE